MYLGDVRHLHRSLETSHSSSCNFRGFHISDVGRCGYRSQYTRHSSSRNCGKIFDVDGTDVYRYQTIHSYSHNPGDRGILSTSPVSLCRVDINFHKK